MNKTISILGIAIFVASSFMVIAYFEPESFGLTRPHSSVAEYDGAASERVLMISEQCLDQKQNPFRDYAFARTSNGEYYIDNVICERINVQQGGCLEPFSKGYPDETCKNRVTFDFPYGEKDMPINKEFCNQAESEISPDDSAHNKIMIDEYVNICTIRGLIDGESELIREPVFTETLPLNNNPEIFSGSTTKFVNPNYESLKYYKTTQVIDDTYLGKNVQQWQDAWDWELESNYEVYKDKFYEELGGLLVKNEITQAMNQVGIINSHDDFEVHRGYSLESLPPHVGFTTVINATDGNSYLIEASAHSNRVNYYAITQLQFFDTAEELSLADILSYPQTIDVLPEDGHKSKAEPADLIIHVDDNAVNFVNRTPESMRIQESGTGEIARERELAWIGPTIPPFGNGQVIFEKPGIYEWDARKAPTPENPLWWDSHARGDIIVLADNVDDLPLEDRLRMGRAIIMNSEIPSAGMGIGNAEHALKISLRSAVYEMLPDAVQHYQDRAGQLIPFDIPMIIEEQYE